MVQFNHSCVIKIAFVFSISVQRSHSVWVHLTKSHCSRIIHPATLGILTLIILRGRSPLSQLVNVATKILAPT
ncbi:hypothetical protein [Nostoc sp.]|uniref:hypothetical protein n=1 Tax=Nostoc sp. TaxID=1180 RepID=UPI002FF60ED5